MTITIPKLLKELEPFDLLSGDDAERMIDEAAGQFGAKMRGFRRPWPRRGEIERSLKKIAEQARALREELAGADEAVLWALQIRGEGFRSLRVRAFAEELPPPLTESRGSSEWTGRLAALEELASAVAENLRPDSGGPEPKSGVAKLELALNCVELFAKCGRPGIAATHNGELHCFAERMLEFSTNGAEPQGETMLTYLKKVLKDDWFGEEERERISETAKEIRELRRMGAADQRIRHEVTLFHSKIDELVLRRNP